MELLWDGGMKICSNVPGHMIKMAVMPVIVKPFKNLLLWNQKADDLKLGMHYRVPEYFQVCSNDDLELTLTYFTARSNLVHYAFVWEKGKTMDFSENIVVYDVKAGGCS